MTPFVVTEVGRAFAWRELLRRCGIPDDAPAPARLVYGDSLSESDASSSGLPVVQVHPSTSNAAADLIRAEPGTLARVPMSAWFPHRTGSIEGDRPVFFATHPQRPIVERVSERTVVFNSDIIATTIFCLSRWEEIGSASLDEHDRFDPTASVAYKHDVLDFPVVDEIACALGAWLREIVPAARFEPPRYMLAVSHDVDRLWSMRGGLGLARRVGGDLLKRRSVRAAAGTLRTFVADNRTELSSEAARGVRELLLRAAPYDARRTFFFIAAQPSPTDGDYDVRAGYVRALMREIEAAGCEIGLHGGYATMRDATALAHQRTVLESVIDAPVSSNRQHYLRFSVPDTWRALDAAGIGLDCSLGHSHHEGFRCGTCHPFRVYDIERDVVLDLREQPLIAMDVTLRHHRGMSPREAVRRVAELASRCRTVGGTFTLLWHNTSLGSEWPGWSEAYTEMLSIAAAGPTA